jgi:hypothetical protein
MKFPVIATKGRVFNGLRLIDANGIEYRVRSAKYVRDSGRRLFSGWFAPKLVEVHLEIDDGRQLTVEEVRSALRAAISSGRDFWASSGERPEFIARLEHVDSMEELWTVVTNRLTRGKDPNVAR